MNGYSTTTRIDSPAELASEDAGRKVTEMASPDAAYARSGAAPLYARALQIQQEVLRATADVERVEAAWRSQQSTRREKRKSSGAGTSSARGSIAAVYDLVI